jgi:hypothetical protein
MNVPEPSHQGQSIVEGSPPRFEITLPVARHAVQGDGSAAAGVSSAATAR